MNRVDVIGGTNINYNDYLSLVDEDSCILYHRGQLHRIVDYLRQYDIIYSGSFNPPHNDHLLIGKNALFEISLENVRKGKLNRDDVIHRLKMLDLLDIPVLITMAPRFLEKDAILQWYWKKPYTYRMGVDTWNTMVGARDLLQNGAEFDNMTSKFEIVPRKGHETIINDVTRHIKFSQIKLTTADISSNIIRGGNPEGLPAKIAAYIKENKLYESQ